MAKFEVKVNVVTEYKVTAEAENDMQAMDRACAYIDFAANEGIIDCLNLGEDMAEAVDVDKVEDED